MNLKIVHDRGPRQGTEEAFSDKAVVSLGRHPGCDVVFQEVGTPIVSGRHAELRVDGDKVFVVDLGSTNGTFVNGRRAQSAELEPDDEVTLGANGPAFRAACAAAPAQTSIPSPETAAPKMYGQKTVGMMIQQALASVAQPKPPQQGTSKSTEYFEALLEKKVRHSSKRLKVIVAISAAAFVVIGAIVGYVVYRNRSVQVIQTTQVSYGDTAGGTIAAANRFNVFMLAGYPATNGKVTGPLQGFCTAFAVSADLLATNAHCVVAGSKRFVSVAALMNGAPANRYQVVQWAAHPGYREGEISPDVGLVRISGKLTSAVTLAEPAELGQVGPGVKVFLYGFPGRLNKEDAPEATFAEGDIGRVTTFDQRLGDFGTNTLLQHSAYCTGGTSGSPMFNAAGHVIGVNAGGYVENGQALAGYNFGMRVDLVNVLFAQLDVRGAATP
jgi:S1-C subfamily serine protease